MYEEFLSDKEYVAELFDYSVPICGVCNPLEDIKWLKEYCKSVKENQDISKVSIHIYIAMYTNEYVFEIKTFSYHYGWATVYRNCAGDELTSQPQDLFWFRTIFNYVKQ